MKKIKSKKIRKKIMKNIKTVLNVKIGHDEEGNRST